MFGSYSFGGGDLGGGWWGHPALTNAQQTANQQVQAARQQLRAQRQQYDQRLDQWEAQVETAALTATATPPSAPSPPTIMDLYCNYLAALAAKKTADAVCVRVRAAYLPDA